MSYSPSLLAVSRCKRETMVKAAMDREYLDAFITSDEHGAYIVNNVTMIIENKKRIEEELSRTQPNQKQINRANDNVRNCIEFIKTRLVRLSAKQDEIDQIVEDIKKADYQAVTLGVLKVMARKNPGMHQRKYKQALQMVAEKQKQR